MIDEDEIDERLVNSDIIDNIESNDISLRPRRISEFIGQPQVQKNLLTFITAAESRKEAMDHVLLFGPPGLGKTTLAQIISIELGVGFRATSGPIINKAGDLAALLTNLKPKDVLLIMFENPQVPKNLIYDYKRTKIKAFRNEAGWNSVYVAGKIIEKIGPILAIKNKDFNDQYVVEKIN